MTRGIARRARMGAIVLVLLAGIAAPLLAATPAAAQAPMDSYVVLLDVSDSMNEASTVDPNRTKLNVAKSALTTAVAAVSPGQINLGLRTFSGCGATSSDLVVPVGLADPGAMTTAINSVTAGGRTDIDHALRQAATDLPAGGARTIVLVSDGEDTCSGDPCSVAAELAASGVDIRIDTIGFQTAGTPAETQLQCIATAAGGSAVSVGDETTLFAAIGASIPNPVPPTATPVPACPTGQIPTDTDGDGQVDRCGTPGLTCGATEVAIDTNGDGVNDRCSLVALQCGVASAAVDIDADGVLDTCVPKAVAVSCSPGEVATDTDGDGVIDRCSLMLAPIAITTTLPTALPALMPAVAKKVTSTTTANETLAVTASTHGPIASLAMLTAGIGFLLLAVDYHHKRRLVFATNHSGDQRLRGTGRRDNGSA